jgi:hypothetical protein
LPLFTGQKPEKPQGRLQKDLGIFILQIRSRQEVRADHLQAEPSGLIAAQHESRRFDRLLNDRQLALVQLENLEIDKSPTVPCPARLVLSRLPD